MGLPLFDANLTTVIKLKDLSPLVRNNNTTIGKAGPCYIMNDPVIAQWRMYIEGVAVSGGPPYDDDAAPYKATASVLQGPWSYSLNQSDRVIVAYDDTTERKERSPASGYWDAANNRWVNWNHYGNNTGPRKAGVDYSTDGVTGLAFTRAGTQPVIGLGSSGQFDDLWLADFKCKPLAGATFLGFYRGVKSGSSATRGTVGRVTGSSNPETMTKYGEVITQGGGGSWNEKGVWPSGWGIDSDGRLHMLVGGANAADVDAMGYYYSDDLGVSWTAYSGNPILSRGTGTAYDLDGCADPGSLIFDGDVIFLTHGSENVTNYATNPPLRAQCAAIIPWRKISPVRPGKFYRNNATAQYTTVTGTKFLSNTAGGIMGRFRAYRVDRTFYRSVYAEYVAFDNELFIRIRLDGKLDCFLRTPTGSAALLSLDVVDDSLWHSFLIRRTATDAFELIIDRVSQSTDATTVGTDATAVTKIVGNYGVPDTTSCLMGTISDLVTIVGYAPTWDEAVNIINRRTFPSNVSATVNFPEQGTDTGDVVLVESASEALAQRIDYQSFPKFKLREARR